MKYLKYFEQASAYEAYKNSSDFITPNVSYVEDNTKLYYSPHTPEAVISYNMVDLGLSVKWADRNVGAANPEDAGLYFAWGDTVGYTAEQVKAGEKTFDLSNYFDTTDGGSTFNKYATDKLTVLEAADDAATVNMGSDWRMPTEAEFTELINGTVPTFIDLQGNEFSKSEAQSGAIAENNFKGVKLTGTNGNSIFIPAAGNCIESMLGVGCYGYLLSSSLYLSNSMYSWFLSFYYNGSLNIGYNIRFCGQSVRGVCN